MTTPAAATLSVRESARQPNCSAEIATRVYALLRSDDLVAVPGTDGDEQSRRIDRTSVERSAVAGGGPRRAAHAAQSWAIIGLASGDQAFSERSIGLLES